MRLSRRPHKKCERCGKIAWYCYTRGYICNRCKREIKSAVNRSCAK